VIPWNQLEAILSTTRIYKYAPTDEQLVLQEANPEIRQTLLVNVEGDENARVLLGLAPTLSLTTPSRSQGDIRGALYFFLLSG
jgi:hypothetical protein